MKKKFLLKRISNKPGNGFENSKGAYYRVFNNGYSKHFRDVTQNSNKPGNGFENSKGAYYKVEENDKRTCLKKKFLLKRIRISQETDLKIPKALITVFLITVTFYYRVFNNGYSKTWGQKGTKHFFEM